MIEARKVLAAAMSEDALLTAVLDLAKARDWLAYHVRNSKAGVIQGDPGFPDLVLVRDGRLVFTELKSETNRTTEAQRAWLARLLEVREVTTVIWRPSDWLSGAIERILA